MKLVYELVFRPRDLDSNLALLRDQFNAASLRRLMWGTLYALLMGGGAAFLAPRVDDGAFIVVVMAAIFIGVVIGLQWSGYRRKREKIDFVEQLARAIESDWHPLKKVRLAIDLRPYHAGGKLTWSGRSGGGKEKNKYRDKWLELDFVYADGTRVEVRREVGVKTKSSSVVREKRRLSLSVTPNPKRYDLELVRADGDKLRKRLKDAVHQLFENHPEDFHVHVDPQSAGFRIKVMQEDAQITADEVFKLLHALIGFLAARRAREA